MYVNFERKWGILPQELVDVKVKRHHIDKEFATGLEEEPRVIQAPPGKRPRMQEHQGGMKSRRTSSMIRTSR